ncbi:MAG: hypothetical protein HJJLKODD_02373 [Phycisphaerae bacterium]|nr:hypothetical protein [Phycisphaerae bacterium]
MAIQPQLGSLPLGWSGNVPQAAAWREWVIRQINRLAALGFWYVILAVIWGSIGYIQLKAADGLKSGLVYGAGHGLGVAALLLLWVWPSVRRQLRALAMWFRRPGRVLLLLVAVTVIRTLWIILVPTPAYSDGACYESLARSLLETGQYYNGKNYAYWPPGYPMLLAGVYALFGYSWFAAKMASVLLAALTEYCGWFWLRRQFGQRVAAVGLLLLVAWPARTFHLDIFSYDDLTMALMLLAMVVLPESVNKPGSAWRWAIAGLLMGFGILTRPPLLLVAGVMVVWWILFRIKGPRAWWRIGAFTAGILCFLLPWNIRNYHLFGQIVPLMNNSGMNIYSGVAAGGGGVYASRLDQEVIDLVGADAASDELIFDATCKKLFWKAITADPLGSMKIWFIDKPIHNWGSDNCVAWLEGYQAIWPQPSRLPELLKAGTLTLSNGYYLVLMLLPLIWIRRVARRLAAHPHLGYVLLIFLLGFVIHTVFQAQPRYHLMYMPFWAMTVAILLFRVKSCCDKTT